MVHGADDHVQRDESSIDERLGCLISCFDRRVRGMLAIEGRAVRVTCDRPRRRGEARSSALAVDFVDERPDPFAAKSLRCTCDLFILEETVDVVEVTPVLEEHVAIGSRSRVMYGGKLLEQGPLRGQDIDAEFSELLPRRFNLTKCGDRLLGDERAIAVHDERLGAAPAPELQQNTFLEGGIPVSRWVQVRRVALDPGRRRTNQGLRVREREVVPHCLVDFFQHPVAGARWGLRREYS